MGKKVNPVFACLSIAYLEESKLFTTVLPMYFSPEQCNWIVTHYKRYVDDGFLPLPNSVNIEDFINCLNTRHPAIKVTYEKAIFENINITY